MNLFLLALCAHLLGDFLLQTRGMVTAKNAGRLWPLLKHGVIITVVTWLATHCYGLKAAFFYALLIGLSHLLIDTTKSCLEKGKSGGTKLLLFLFDQGLHLFTLFVFFPLFPTSDPDPHVISFYQRLQPATPVLARSFPPALPYWSLEKSLWIIVVYLAAVFGGAVLITRILAWLTDQPQPEKGRRLSNAIGIMERLILITLVVTDAIAAMGFVLAAKSLARYQELNDREFAEYYLVGTLTSFSLALLAGLWLTAIL
jgi:hypothetical protein